MIRPPPVFTLTSTTFPYTTRFRSRQTVEIYRDALRAMIALTIGGTLLAIGLGLMLTRSLTRQLGGEPLEVARVANSISQGNLATRISTRRAHSKSVIRAMRHMQESLHKIVVAVRESSESVADGSRRIATGNADLRSEEHTSELQSLMRISYAVFCLKNKTKT